MKKITIPFSELSKRCLIVDEKWATTRTQRYGKIGDRFDVEYDGSIMRYQLYAVFPLKLDIVAQELYWIEGFTSPRGFIKIWHDLHPRLGWTPNKIVYVHFFMRYKE